MTAKRYALPHWRGLLIIAGAAGASIGLNLLGPWPTKILVDYVLGPHVVHALHHRDDRKPQPQQADGMTDPTDDHKQRQTKDNLHAVEPLRTLDVEVDGGGHAVTLRRG